MATQDQKNDTAARELNSQAIALAEQLGRMAGTLEGTAEAWLNRTSLTDQLTKVRDGAAQLLNTLSGAASIGRNAVTRAATAASKKTPTGKPAANSGKGGTSRSTSTASADPSHAPGKRHRKPAPTAHGVKSSDESIPKAKTAAAARRRRKSYA
jgi:hypothetical protein